MSLKQKTIVALSWSACERFVQQGLQFIITIFMARLLSPVEFGLIGMLTIFMALAQSFVESGFGQALIQKQDSNYTDECSIFYFNIFIGAFSALFLCLVAPLIATFFGQPLLVPLTQALSLNLIFNSFGLIHISLLHKQIDFKTLFKAGFGATFASGVIGIAMAYKGFGIWSLICQSLSRTLINTFFLWFLNSWRPSMVFSFNALSKLLVFSSRLLFSGISDTIFGNIYILLIGKLFSPVILGYYTQAKLLQHLPVSNICTIVSRVTFSIFSTLQNDKEMLKSCLKKAITTLTMVIFPMMVGLGLLAKNVVVVLLGEKWLPCAPYIQLFCMVGVFWPLHVINLNVLISLGHSDLLFRIEILKKILTFISVGITFRWGIIAMLWGQIGTSFIGYYLNSYYTNKLLGYSMFDQIRDFYPYLFVSIGMGLIVLEVGFLLENTYSALILQIFIVIVVYSLVFKTFQLKAF